MERTHDPDISGIYDREFRILLSYQFCQNKSAFAERTCNNAVQLTHPTGPIIYSNLSNLAHESNQITSLLETKFQLRSKFNNTDRKIYESKLVYFTRFI